MSDTPKRRRGPSRAFSPAATASERTPRRSVAVAETWKPNQKDEKLLNFLFKKSILIKKPASLIPLFKEYKQESQDPCSPITIQMRFRKSLASRIHELDGFDDETKARLLYITCTPVDSEFLKKLRKSAHVEVDTYQRIVKFESPNMKLSGKPSTSAGIPKSCLKRKSILNTSNDSDPLSQVSIPSQVAPSQVAPSQMSTPMAPLGLDIEMLGGMCAPMQMIKAEPPEEPGYGGQQQEMVPNNYFGGGGANQYPMFPVPYPVVFPGAMMVGMSNLFNSLTGLVQSQTELIREMITVKNPSVVATPPPPPPPASSEDTLSISTPEFLKHIQAWIQKSNQQAQLGEIHHKIVMGLQGERKIAISRMKLALDAAFSICSTGISNGAQMQHSVSLKEFATMLLMFAASQQMFEFCGQFKQKIDGIGAHDVIPIEKVRTALDAAVGIVLD